MREYGVMARCLLTGRVHRGPAIKQLTGRLAAMYAPSEVFLLNYAHHGIGLALSWFRCQWPERDEVIVPAYICPSVPQSVRALGLKVRCVPVGDDLNLTTEGVRQAIGPKTLAVIAPHMYGCPAPIEALEALCRDFGVCLVDDAAQVVGERVAGRLLGTFGDVGVISFAQSKAIVTGIRGSGAVLLVNRPAWHDQAERAFSALPVASKRFWPWVDFLWNYVGAQYTGTSGYYFKRLMQLAGIPAAKHLGAMCISNLEAAVALTQLERWPCIKADRTRVLDVYRNHWPAINSLELPQYQQGRFLARMVVRLPPWVDATFIQHYLINEGIETRQPYPRVPEDSDSGLDRLRSCLICLPLASNLNPTDISEICTILVRAISAYPKLPFSEGANDFWRYGNQK